MDKSNSPLNKREFHDIFKKEQKDRINNFFERKALQNKTLGSSIPEN